MSTKINKDLIAYFKENTGKTREEMATDLTAFFGGTVTVEDVDTIKKRVNEIETQTGVKREFYHRVLRRAFVSWNEPEEHSSFKHSIVGYRKAPATISTHKDDTIDGEPVVTSVVHGLRIDVLFFVFEFEWVRPCEHYPYKGSLV